MLTTVRKNCRVSILHLAVADIPRRTISGLHRSFLPESLLILRIVLDANVSHPIAELASRPRMQELLVGGTGNYWLVFAYRKRPAWRSNSLLAAQYTLNAKQK